jgi:hypothetical protein
MFKYISMPVHNFFWNILRLYLVFNLFSSGYWVVYMWKGSKHF